MSDTKRNTTAVDDWSGLHQSVDNLSHQIDLLLSERAELIAQRDALLAALKHWQDFDRSLQDRQDAAIAAIARAEAQL
jgi:hypothetical protein